MVKANHPSHCRGPSATATGLLEDLLLVASSNGSCDLSRVGEPFLRRERYALGASASFTPPRHGTLRALGIVLLKGGAPSFFRTRRVLPAREIHLRFRPFEPPVRKGEKAAEKMCHTTGRPVTPDGKYSAQHCEHVLVTVSFARLDATLRLGEVTNLGVTNKPPPVNEKNRRVLLIGRILVDRNGSEGASGKRFRTD